MTARRLLLAGALLLALLPASVARAQLRIGIGDQKVAMFSDPRFALLGVHIARYTVGWDALSDGGQRARLDQWLFAARATGVEPLLTFGHSSREGRRRVLPTAERFGSEFRQFLSRYPWVRDYAIWNEANHCGEPVCHRVKLVVAYYKAARRACPSCRILAAELLDFPNMVGWVHEFQRDAGGLDPRYWGLHNYRDANRLTTVNTQALLGATSGEIWFTETGGLVARRNKSNVSFPQSPSHAAKATRWVFDKLVTLSPRITRAYLYQWNASSRLDTWDSALIGPDGRARPALAVLTREMQARRRPAPPPVEK